jgi:hypothetical protein
MSMQTSDVLQVSEPHREILLLSRRRRSWKVSHPVDQSEVLCFSSFLGGSIMKHGDGKNSSHHSLAIVVIHNRLLMLIA